MNAGLSNDDISRLLSRIDTAMAELIAIGEVLKESSRRNGSGSNPSVALPIVQTSAVAALTRTVAANE
jgi:hypothetical protein